jgi:hypothetical protein
MSDNKITTIKLEKGTKERLEALKEHRRETYNDTINKMLNIINITITNPVRGAKIFRNIKKKKTTEVYQEHTYKNSEKTNEKNNNQSKD